MRKEMFGKLKPLRFIIFFYFIITFIYFSFETEIYSMMRIDIQLIFVLAPSFVIELFIGTCNIRTFDCDKDCEYFQEIYLEL